VIGGEYRKNDALRSAKMTSKVSINPFIMVLLFLIYVIFQNEEARLRMFLKGI
jgi:hypothetical protein